MPSTDGQPRDFGNATIGGVDLATELLKSGWAKAKELKRDPTEEDTKRKDLENEARSASKGMWNPSGPKVRPRLFVVQPGFQLTILVQPLSSPTRSIIPCPQTLRRLSMNGRASPLMVSRVGSLVSGDLLRMSLLALVEQVRDGTTVRVRLYLPDDVHQFANIALAGAKSNRASAREGETAEQWGEEVSVTFFCWTRRL